MCPPFFFGLAEMITLIASYPFLGLVSARPGVRVHLPGADTRKLAVDTHLPPPGEWNGNGGAGTMR